MEKFMDSIRYAARREGRMRRILVVDDDPALLQMLSWALEQADMLPTLASGGEGARLAFAGAGPFDAVLIDRHLRREDGRQLADDLVRRGQPRVQVLLMSGLPDATSGYALVPKPFRLHDLIETLKEACDGA